MIVKNEEEFLPRCLRSIQNAVDEIIIVDTGSTDNTITIAKNSGAKVYNYLWNDSFSEARNHSLLYASGDWILQIDADEELEQADIPLLQTAVNNFEYTAIVVAIHSIIKDNTHKFYNTRLFRRGKGFYKDIIHEQIVTEGKRLPTEISLYHHGYNLDKKKMEEKWQRTTYLLKKQIEQSKFDGFAWFNLIRNYRTQELFQDGIRAGEKALSLIYPDLPVKSQETSVNLHHYAMIIYETANCYLHNKNILKTKELCNTALSKLRKLQNSPDNIDIIFTLACAYTQEGCHYKAIDHFNRFLSLRKWYLQNINTNLLLVDTLGYDYAAYHGIGYCFGNLGKWKEAITYFLKSISHNPKYLIAYKNLASCYFQVKDIAEAANTLLKAVSEGIADDDVMLKLAEFYREQKAYKKAVHCFEMYLKKHPEDKGALLTLAQSYEQLGNLGAALVGHKTALSREEGERKPEVRF